MADIRLCSLIRCICDLHCIVIMPFLVHQMLAGPVQPGFNVWLYIGALAMLME